MLYFRGVKFHSVSKTLAAFGLIFLLVASLANGSCPTDLLLGTHACFTAFTLSYERMRQSQQKLCCGLDVETLRALCRAYVDAMSCVDGVKSQCPEEKHLDIENALINLDGAKEELSGLCSDDTIIENYAMQQTCLTAAGPGSETCLAMILERGVRQHGDERSGIRFLSMVQATTLDVFCRKMNSAISCVQRNVQRVCGQQAASLVPSLVRPMVRYSATCNSGHSNHPTKWPFLLDDVSVKDDHPVERGITQSQLEVCPLEVPLQVLGEPQRSYSTDAHHFPANGFINGTSLSSDEE
ncbi:hypothetical protein RRG08_027986 [Elysia crispata]|uniref:Uncharacterized protein n=1 Tax=Elysia crispata TaxID=231223 RepID=A0AAE1BB12_9GAST|nr:hypothetical protein RRG08_027986 [Elysia crispata]